MLGYQVEGHGAEPVIFLHDWFCDASSYDAIKPYLPWNKMTGAFVDLRGYGRSKAIQGVCDIEEVANDVLAVADKQKWPSFHLVGHSMTGLVAQYMAATSTDRLKTVMAVTPVPATGSPVPPDIMMFLEDAARRNDLSAMMCVHMMTSNRYTDTFIANKVDYWRTCSHEEARVAYLRMFTQTDVVNQVAGCQKALRVVVGRFDAPTAQKDVMQQTVMTFFPKATLVELDAGHYPMQEVPVAFATEIERLICG